MNFRGITAKLIELEIIQKTKRIEENQRKLADKAAKYNLWRDLKNRVTKLTHNSTKSKNEITRVVTLNW